METYAYVIYFSFGISAVSCDLYPLYFNTYYVYTRTYSYRESWKQNTDPPDLEF